MESKAFEAPDRSKEVMEVFTLWNIDKSTEGAPAPQPSVQPAATAAPISTSADTGEISDQDYYYMGLGSDATFRSLDSGNRCTNDESAADLALMNKLAYWCNRNPEVMKQGFLDSLHHRQKDEAHKKKCRRKDYLDRTIKTAVAGTPVTAREKDTAYKAEQAKKAQDVYGVKFEPLRPHRQTSRRKSGERRTGMHRQPKRHRHHGNALYECPPSNREKLFTCGNRS